MKRPVCVFACILLVFVVFFIEWGNWFRNMDQTPKARLTSPGWIPLATIRMSRKALESYKLPLKSEAAVVLDVRKGEVLFEKNMDEKLPVASLTKLMSALVFLQTNPDLDDTVTLTRSDVDCVGTCQIEMDETLTLRDLLHTSLMSSSNRATKALVRSSGLPPSLFVARMNRRASEFGLENTFFCEPTGLDDENRSTALDCARLLYFCLQDSVISSVLGRSTYEFVSLDGEGKKHEIRSTNGLLFPSFKVKGGKTGYIGASGWCLGTLLESDEGTQIAAVLLGAPSKHARFEEIRSIVEWSVKKNKTGS